LTAMVVFPTPPFWFAIAMTGWNGRVAMRASGYRSASTAPDAASEVKREDDEGRSVATQGSRPCARFRPTLFGPRDQRDNANQPSAIQQSATRRHQHVRLRPLPCVSGATDRSFGAPGQPLATHGYSMEQPSLEGGFGSLARGAQSFCA
jgi:hypothetical protein